jgi:hypothetical protein
MSGTLRRSSLAALGATTLLLVGAAAVPRAEQRAPAATAPDVTATLERATARVKDFFERAQSLVCTERVHVQPLSYGLSGDGFGRTVESELRVSWDGDAGGASEARAMRQVMKVNGHKPRRNDRNNCTTPERHDTEPQVLSMLLPDERDDYTWALAGAASIDGRPALLLDFREKEALSLEVSVQDDDEDCLTYTVRGGSRGRLWLDAESHDVMRLDQHLVGQANAPMPRILQRRPGASPTMTVERFDTSYRFKRMRFENPEETLVLPVSSTSLRITQGGGAPRMRVTTEYRDYHRFLTGGRLVPGPGPQ